jgi:hypothetical protein
VGPDYDVKTGGKVELTTPGEVAKHKAKKGEYSTCEYATYDRPKK